MIICLEQDADLHMAQLMPLPLTVSCFSKIQIGFTFLVPADMGSPGKRAVKCVCVCVCACVRACVRARVRACLRAHARACVCMCARVPITYLWSVLCTYCAAGRCNVVTPGQTEIFKMVPKMAATT